MAIIRYTKDATIRYAYLNIFPDQFKTEKEKQDESWIKNTMDYFANKAYAEYVKNRDTFVKNYDLMKGILRMEDFYQEPHVKSFTDMLEADLQLPAYVKHYSIVTTPVNELVGEISKRPDTYRVKAFDDDSQSEELQFKTDVLQQFVINQVKQKIYEKAAMEGQEISDEEVQQMTMDEVKEELDSYTSVAEKWANHILTCQKADFNLKEKSEDAFRDLLISAREFYHIYEDNSKLGFNIEVANPKTHGFLPLLIESGFQIPQAELRVLMLLVQYKLWSYQRSLKAYQILQKRKSTTYARHSKTMDLSTLENLILGILMLLKVSIL